MVNKNLILYAHHYGNLFLEKYNNLKTKIFFLSDIKDNNNYNLFYKFYFFYYLNYLFSMSPSCVLRLINRITNYYNNCHYKLLKITVTNGHIHRNLIYKNTKLYSIINYCNHFKDSFPEIFNSNETIMSKKLPVTDIYYFTNSGEKKSIRSIINKYADKNKYYENNSVKNILEIENVKLSEIKDKQINVTYMRLTSKKDKIYNLENDDYHVSDLFNLE